MLDTYREVMTPEGVLLQLPAAGAVPRALAWLIDSCIRWLILGMLGMLASFLGKFGMGLLLIALFFFSWGYSIVMEAMWGCTLGKRCLGLRVIMADGAPLGWTAAITRNLLRVIDILPLGYALGLLSSLMDAHGRRLGDLVAGTLVVHVSRAATLPPSQGAGSQALPFPLQPAEQQAVLAFAERAPRLSPVRREELAAMAGTLSQTSGPEGVSRLYAIANGLLGRGR